MFGMKRVFFGTVIFSLGAFSGFIVGKKMLEKQYREDVSEIKEFYKSKLDELGVMDDSFEPEEQEEDNDWSEEEEDEEEDNHKEEIKNIINTCSEVKRQLVDYTKYAKPSLEDMRNALFEKISMSSQQGVSVVVETNGEEKLGRIDENDEENDDEYTPSDDPDYEAEIESIADDYARRRLENMKKGEPYLIESDEYQEGPEDYDRQALYYYSKDRTLCEDDDSGVEDEEECVGFDYEDKLDMQMTCWVRNDKLRVLYEIHRIDDSYKKAVLGVSETPREREFRIQGRRKQALDDGFKVKRG